jgi:hypothetical protein
MKKHKELREKFGNVLETDNAIEVLEVVEQWLIERENQALRIHDVVGRSEQLKAFIHFAEFAKQEYGLHIPLNLMKEYVKSL